MRSMGLEPTRLAAQEPKSCMSANSITTADYFYTDIFSELIPHIYQSPFVKPQLSMYQKTPQVQSFDPQRLSSVLSDAGLEPATT